MISKSKDFFSDQIWLIPESELAGARGVMIKSARILLLSVYGFVKDLCSLRAAALTLFTLLSIVPVIALLFGIAKGFGFESMLREELVDKNPQQGGLMLQLIEFAENMLANTQGGVVAGIGVAVLLWTVIKVIGNIEESFNHIWKIEKGRSLARKVTDYLSIMMLAPVLLITSGSLTVLIKTQLTHLMDVINLHEAGKQLVALGLGCLPIVIMALLFSFIFLFIPNRQISLKAGFIAGGVTGVAYQMVQWAYLTLQIGASSYNAIYGSFAALPLFLVWLQICWSVVLMGCQVAFYIQNYASYCHNERFSDLSLSIRKAIALRVMHLIINRFSHGEPALNADDISRMLELPLSVVKHTLYSLLDGHLVVAINGQDVESVQYQPGYDINSMTVFTIIKALEISGNNALPDTEALAPYYEMLEKVNLEFKNSQTNLLLKDMDLSL